jgi:carboxyl-terminal processing protease
MLTGLDPHSDYMNATEFARMESDMTGKFAGLGMTIEEENGLPQVLAPVDGTPAAKAGIEPGDLIVQIDGRPTDGMPLDDVVSRLRGAIGSKVTVMIERDGQKPFNLTLTRATISVPSVKSVLEAGNIGYARIATFDENTQEEMLEAISELQRKAGGHLNGFILDLRDDPGGELDAAIDVAGDFLDGGTIVTTRGREKGDNHAFTAARIIPVQGGGALRLTTALYYTPHGRSIQGIGLRPDIPVALPKNQEVANAVAFSESDYFGAIRNPGSIQGGETVKPPKPIPPPEVRDFAHPIKPELIATANDAQLKAAVNYLQGIARNGKPFNAERLEGAANVQAH